MAQGECILSIAAESGFLRDTLWAEAGNKELSKAREKPHALLPGDRVDVPPVEPKTEPCQIEATNRFRLRSEPALLRMRVLDMGDALSNAQYTLDIADEVIVGTTDGDGIFEAEIPADARHARLTLEREGRSYAYRLALGSIDPKDSVSGAQGRLSNLGYRTGSIDGAPGSRTKAALRQFQHDNGLETSGALDAATCKKLEEIYGG